MNRLLIFCTLLLVAINVHGDSKILIPRAQREKKIARVADDPTPPPNPAPAPQPAPLPPPLPPPPANDAPVLSVPKELTGKIGAWITVKSATNCAEVQWFTPDDHLSIFPQEQLKDLTATVVSAMLPGQYKLYSYTGNCAGVTPPSLTIITIQGPRPPPDPQPDPNPKPPDPVPPPVTLATNLWVVTVDNVAKRDAATTAVLTDNALWNSVAAAGHQVRILNSTDPNAQKFKPMIDSNGGIPVIVIMDANKTTHNWMNQDPNDTKLRATSQGIKDLINKYTTNKVQ